MAGKKKHVSPATKKRIARAIAASWRRMSAKARKARMAKVRAGRRKRK